MSVWEFYHGIALRIATQYPDTLANCETIIENLWVIKVKLDNDLNAYAKRTKTELEPKKQFVLTFFLRNISYLISAFQLTKHGLVNPARNNTRTVYEQILRSILFDKYPEEAQLLYDYITTSDENLRQEISGNPRRYWNFKYMSEKLYEEERLEGHKKFYNAISWFAHPNIKSLWSDFGQITEVEDTLRGIQGLTYNSLEIFQVLFKSIISSSLNELIEDTMTVIGIHLKNINNFMPNKN